MVSLPVSPTITCGFGSSPVALVATYKGRLLPITNASVRFQYGGLLKLNSYSTTNILGLAQSCIISTFAVGAFISKSDIDFGSGLGKEHYIGEVTAITRASQPYMFGSGTPKIVESVTPAPGIPSPLPITLPCVGTIVADVPDFSSLLSNLTSPPTSILIPVKVTGDKTSVPMRILVDGIEVSKRSTGYKTFDLINILNYVGANINVAHTIRIESTATDCTIEPATFTSPSLKPTGIPTPGQLCSQFMTTVDPGYPSHPSGITDFAAPFYVYIRGIREVCKSDPTNPNFRTRLPKGTPGTITLGNLSSNFYLTEEGIADDIDLSKLMNLSSLSGAAPSLIPTAPLPTPTPSPTKTGRLGVPGIFYVGTAEVQSYLNQFFPGGVAEQGTGTWSGAYKITRGSGGKYPSGTYFWTVTWEDIKSLY